MTENKYIDKGLTGLLNLGNSCYMNSALQIIGNIHELNEHINLELMNTEDINNLDFVIK